MKALILILAIISLKINCIELSSDIEIAWKGYKSFYGLRFSQSEDEQRFEIFKANYLLVVGLNGISSINFKINEFSHLTNEEFQYTKFGSIASLDGDYNDSLAFDYDAINATDEFDWRNSDYVTPVKNQFSCGSSYAYAAISAFETTLAIKTKELKVFSAKRVIQCLRKKFCAPRSVNDAFLYMETIGLDEENIDSYNQFPYTTIGTCKANATYKLANYNRGPTDEEQLKKIVYSQGPVVAIVDASQLSFRFYSSGVYSDTNCNINKLNHELTIVGYGVEDGQDYWLCKNSWGNSWGSNGYIKIARGQNTCGIATNTYFLRA